MSALLLKLIALLTMTIDHVGATFFSDISLFRIIGRISFPIYCFLLVQGFLHTSNCKRYFVRLSIYALLSEVPYHLLFYKSLNYLLTPRHNIFFELSAGMLALLCAKQIQIHFAQKAWHKAIVFALLALTVCFFSELCGFSYGAYGILLILSFYFLSSRLVLLFLPLLILTFLYCLYHQTQLQFYAVLAYFPLVLYNGEKGKPMPKHAFYLYYPLHLLMLYAAARLLGV